MGYNGGLYNLYEYVGNDPTDYEDPSGLQQQPNQFIDTSGTFSVVPETKLTEAKLNLLDKKIGYSQWIANIIYGANIPGREVPFIGGTTNREKLQVLQVNTLDSWFIDASNGTSRKATEPTKYIVDAWNISPDAKTAVQKKDKIALKSEDTPQGLFFFAETVKKQIGIAQQNVPIPQNENSHTYANLDPATLNPFAPGDPLQGRLRTSIDGQNFRRDLDRYEYTTMYFWIDKDCENKVSPEHLREVKEFITEAGFRYNEIRGMFEGYTVKNLNGQTQQLPKQ